jgi:hypothetical protein
MLAKVWTADSRISGIRAQCNVIEQGAVPQRYVSVTASLLSPGRGANSATAMLAHLPVHLSI